MTPLNDALDDVGWAQKENWKHYTALIFAWMEQATTEIERLQDEVATLRRQVPDNR